MPCLASSLALYRKQQHSAPADCLALIADLCINNTLISLHAHPSIQREYMDGDRQSNNGLATSACTVVITTSESAQTSYCLLHDKSLADVCERDSLADLKGDERHYNAGLPLSFLSKLIVQWLYTCFFAYAVARLVIVVMIAAAVVTAAARVTSSNGYLYSRQCAAPPDSVSLIASHRQ